MSDWTGKTWTGRTLLFASLTLGIIFGVFVTAYYYEEYKVKPLENSYISLDWKYNDRKRKVDDLKAQITDLKAQITDLEAVVLEWIARETNGTVSDPQSATWMNPMEPEVYIDYVPQLRIKLPMIPNVDKVTICRWRDGETIIELNTEGSDMLDHGWYHGLPVGFRALSRGVEVGEMVTVRVTCSTGVYADWFLAVGNHE